MASAWGNSALKGIVRRNASNSNLQAQPENRAKQW
jgi:hypothetical protein